MIARPASPLPGNGAVDALAQDGLVLGDQADVGQPLLHDDGPHLGALGRVGGFLEGLERDAVPAVGLLEHELALQLQVQRVALAQADELVLGRHLARDVQLAAARVEVGRRHADRQRRVHSLRRRRARRRRQRHLAHRRRPQRVQRPDQVVRVPHVFGLLGEQRRGACPRAAVDGLLDEAHGVDRVRLEVEGSSGVRVVLGCARRSKNASLYKPWC